MEKGIVTMKSGKRAIISTSDNRLYVAGGITAEPGQETLIPTNSWACRSMMFAISILYSDNPDAEIAALEGNGKWSW